MGHPSESYKLWACHGYQDTQRSIDSSLKKLDLVNHCKIIPAINQVKTHVFRQQKKLRQPECQIGTKHESWSPMKLAEVYLAGGKIQRVQRFNR